MRQASTPPQRTSLTVRVWRGGADIERAAVAPPADAENETRHAHDSAGWSHKSGRVNTTGKRRASRGDYEPVNSTCSHLSRERRPCPPYGARACGVHMNLIFARVRWPRGRERDVAWSRCGSA